MSVLWKIELLGGLRAIYAGRTFSHFGTQKRASLLGYLAYYRHLSHPREVLIEAFWPGGEPRSGYNNLRQAIHSLRRQLEPPGIPAGAVLVTNRFNIQLNPETVITDVAEFESALQSAQESASQVERIHHLARAVEIYQGELLPGYYEDWVGPLQQRLADLHLGAIRQLVLYHRAAGDIHLALDYAHQAVTLHPLREGVGQQLMDLQAAASARANSSTSSTPVPPAPVPSSGTTVSPPAASPLPAGTITFLFIELTNPGILAEAPGQGSGERDTLLDQVRCKIQSYQPLEAGESDGLFFTAFPTAQAALESALALHQTVPSSTAPCLKMALHTGDIHLQMGQWKESMTFRRAQALLLAAHPGQVLASGAAASLLHPGPASGVRLQYLGLYRLSDNGPAERLFQVEYPGASCVQFPFLRASFAAGSLPLQFTRFFGRAEELVRLAEILEDGARLVTLTGPGGSGKTRLSIEAARQRLDSLQGAAWFVSLEAITDPSRIIDAIQAALKLTPPPGASPLDEIARALSLQPSLLLLDNFEQFLSPSSLHAPTPPHPYTHTLHVPAALSIVQSLLERVPSLACMVTSRHCLGLSGEREFTVRPLETPRGEDNPVRLAQYPSVALFVDRAQAVRSNFQLTRGNAAAISALCDGLEGIPLALELAAARCQGLSPGQMLQQLQHRFDFLVSRRRDISERRRTLRAAIDWSCDLLEPRLQSLFASLSIFRGGWTLEAAASVCVGPPDPPILGGENCSVGPPDPPNSGGGKLLRWLTDSGGRKWLCLLPSSRRSTDGFGVGVSSVVTEDEWIRC